MAKGGYRPGAGRPPKKRNLPRLKSVSVQKAEPKPKRVSKGGRPRTKTKNSMEEMLEALELFPLVKEKFEELDAESQRRFLQLQGKNVQWEKFLAEKSKESKFEQVAETLAHYQRDIVLFRSHYLDRKRVEWQERRLRMIYQLLRQGYRWINFIDPKRHGKTGIVQDFIIHWLTFNRMDIVKYFTESESLAIEKIKPIRDQFENNRRLNKDFGPFRRVGNVWGAEKFTIARPKNIEDPSVQALGLTSTFTGKNCDVLIYDDPTHAGMSSKVIKTYHDLLLGEAMNTLRDGGFVIGIMTRKGYKDLAACFLDEDCWICHENHKQSSKTFVNQAIISGDYKTEGPDTYRYVRDPEGTIIGVEVYGDYEVFAPDFGWTIEELLLKRQQVGTIFFEREYQNNPTPLKGLKFKDEYICTYKKLSEILHDLRNYPVYIAVDLALSEEQAADYTGVVCFTIDELRNIIILDIAHRRQTLANTFNSIHNMAVRWRRKAMSVSWFVEAVAGFGVLTKDWPDNTWFPIKFIKKVKGRKIDRILSLEGLFQNHKIWFHSSMNQLKFEILNFPETDDNHLLDALEMGISQVNYMSSDFDIRGDDFAY